jgi:hypothetical protein
MIYEGQGRMTMSSRLARRRQRKLGVPGILTAACLISGLGLAAPAAVAAAASTPSGPASTAVKVCGLGAAVARPGSIVLTCADKGELAVRLHWSSWGATQATATGIVTWRACSADCADSTRWDRTSADVTLDDPASEPDHEVLFTRLELHVTGSTPRGFLRNVAFDEAPAAPIPAAAAAAAAARARQRHAQAVPRSSAPSGTLGYAQIEGYWVDAGGATGSQGGYTDPQIAAAISGAESSYQPGVIQPGEPYSGAGWGLWQITPGNELSASYGVSEYGTDFQILDPWNNAESAVYLYDVNEQAGYNGFDRWSTYTDGAYDSYLQQTGADTQLTDPGEYVQVNSTPAGTPSSPPPDPGSTYGPPIPGTAAPANSPSVAVTSNGSAFVFWEGTDGNLWQGQGPADGALAGPYNRGMGPLGSAPAAAVNANGDTYVYWRGSGPNHDLWEAYWNGKGWVGPYNRGMGPLGSPPTVALTSNGTAFVFWEGTDGNLWEAQGPADGALAGPYNHGMGPLGSAPTAGTNANGDTYVYWRGSGPNHDLWEGYWNGKTWVGPYNRGMGPLGSAPSVAVTSNGTAFVFWEGTDGNLWEAQGPADGALAGPYNHGMGPLGSGPTAATNANGDTYVYWRGSGPNHDLWEGYWNGKTWVGPYNRGMGPLS